MMWTKGSQNPNPFIWNKVVEKEVAWKHTFFLSISLVECLFVFFILLNLSNLALSCLQLKDMAERLPVGAGRNNKIPSLVSCTSPVSSDTSAQADRLSSPLSFMVPVSNGSNSVLVPNGIAVMSNRNPIINKSGYPEATRNGSKISDVDTIHDAEWVEQDEPGVYITLTSLPGGVKDLKRVRFR